MNEKYQNAKSDPRPRLSPAGDVPFGVNEMRLTARQWLIAIAILLVVALSTPAIWEKVERFTTGPDYRLPYLLSKDYWLYGRRLREVKEPSQIVLLGDSVVWGEYVLPDGTLSHFLNQQSGETNRFVNGGVNGLFPLALEGLVRNYGQSLRHRKVIVHCNLLWMTSPKADLSLEKEEPFNHSRLVPQFRPRIPSYKADASERLGAIVERNVSFLSWVNHLQDAYFGQKSILKWTLADDGGSPPRYPNVWRNPLSQINLAVPGAPEDDPQRGPRSARHIPWSTNAVGTTRFDWVALESSLQWHAFQRVIEMLEQRDDEIFVVLGPFNEHMIAGDNRPTYRELRDGVAAWLSKKQIAHAVPEPLPSLLYADASHPLTEGYEQLAKQIFLDASFQKWLVRK